MANSPKQGKPKSLKDHLRYVDRPDAPEIFADEFGNVTGNGQTMKIELLSHRINEPKPGDTHPTGSKMTVARIVLGPGAIVEWLNASAKIREMMIAKGMVTLEGSDLKPTTPLN